MKHQLVRIALLVALALTLSLGQIIPAAAQPVKPPEDNSTEYPGCQASASALFGPAPLTVDFSAKSPDEGVAYNWGFGDGLGATGKNVTHTFTAEGVYRVRAFVTGADGFYNTCPLLIITVGADPNPAIPTNTPPAPTPDTTATPSGATSGSVNVQGSIDGDNNIAPVINGDGNQIDITIEVAPTATVAPAPVYTTPKSFFWQFVKSILDWIASPMNSWRDWIVEHK